jgi:hypothetical protein
MWPNVKRASFVSGFQRAFRFIVTASVAVTGPSPQRQSENHPAMASATLGDAESDVAQKDIAAILLYGSPAYP